MKVTRFAPTEALAPFVRVYEIIEADETMLRMLVPETGLIVGFRYSGSATLVEGSSRILLPRNSVTGLRSTARHMLTSPGGGIVLAKFREGGAAPFLDPPLYRLFGTAVPLEELVAPTEVELTSARVASAKSHRQRVDAVEQFLLARMARSAWRADPLVTATLQVIRAHPATLRVGAFAREHGLSVDALEKRFRRVVGASPKQLASIVRLRRAIESHRKVSSLTRVALDAGYYDQAHFNRQFVAVTGAAPRTFLTTAEYCM